jgi:hypothetical protein
MPRRKMWAIRISSKDGQFEEAVKCYSEAIKLIGLEICNPEDGGAATEWSTAPGGVVSFESFCLLVLEMGQYE